ncbi:ras-related protein Rab-40B isoform X1 [Eulemur rufifrons]|uniref:ras-related protein Rab-40B isoform X1 n=1 Tax=Eulemur rufifrons TaxID=859984 RepID=UPI003743C960
MLWGKGSPCLQTRCLETELSGSFLVCGRGLARAGRAGAGPGPAGRDTPLATAPTNLLPPGERRAWLEAPPAGGWRVGPENLGGTAGPAHPPCKLGVCTMRNPFSPDVAGFLSSRMSEWRELWGSPLHSHLGCLCPSAGIDYKTTTILLDGRRVKLQLWDTSGQGRFCTIFRSYSRGAQGVILVYDIANRWSFDGIDRWIKEIDEHAPGVPKILVGNRLHLAFKRQVPTEQAQAYAERLGVTFFEVSPLCNFNITESFTELARTVLLRHGMDRLWRPSKGRPAAGPGPASALPGTVWSCSPWTIVCLPGRVPGH